MRTLNDLPDDIAGKRVLMRVDFNVPLDKKTHEITNDMRIRRALPTIRHVTRRGGKAILMSHLGRPDGEARLELSMKKVADRLAGLLGEPVSFAPDCVGSGAMNAVKALKDGGVLMLENVRFHAEEEDNEPAFADELAALGELFVDDAFGTVHRCHASVVGVPGLLPSFAGLLVEREIACLSRVIESPEHPFVAVMGGAKVKDKIGAIRNLLKIADAILVGGAMAYAFLRAQGKCVGDSMVDEKSVPKAAELLEAGAGKILLPVDHLCARQVSEDAEVVTCEDDILDGLKGLDIGPRTAEAYANLIRKASVVTWNGPMGYAEIKQFAKGTEAVARAMAACGGVTVVGGGESAEAVEALGLQDKMTHVSTGGGACLEFLAGEELAGIAALK